MASRHFMNPAHGRHMGSKAESIPAKGAGDVDEGSGQHHPPHIHVHESEGKLHVHVMHHGKADEHHEHEIGDSEGAAEHLHEHFGGGNEEGQDHGYSAGTEEENEWGGGGPGV